MPTIKDYIIQLQESIEREYICMVADCSDCIHAIFYLQQTLMSRACKCNAHNKDIKKYANDLLRSLPDELIFEAFL